MFMDDAIPERTPISPNRVMIVDGNRLRYQAVAEDLESREVEVYYTNDRRAVIGAAQKFSPDLVIMSLFLGTGSTISLLREIKGLLPRVRILLVTNQMTKDNIKEFIRSGANDCIWDPFETETLLKRIQYQLQERDFVSPEQIEKNDGDIAPFFQLSFEVQRILAETRDAHEALHSSLSTVQKVCRSNRVNIIRGNITDSTGYVVVSSDDKNFSNKDIDLERYPEVREVLLSDSILFVKDISQNPLTKKIQDNVKTIKIESLLVVPIRYRAETYAVMVIRFPMTAEGVSPLLMKTLYMVGMMLASKIAAKDFMKSVASKQNQLKAS